MSDGDVMQARGVSAEHREGKELRVRFLIPARGNVGGQASSRTCEVDFEVIEKREESD